MQLSVAILRVRNGLDLSKKIVFGDQPPPVTNSTSASPNHNNLTNVSDPTIPRNQSAISQFSQGKLSKLLYSAKLFNLVLL